MVLEHIVFKPDNRYNVSDGWSIKNSLDTEKSSALHRHLKATLKHISDGRFREDRISYYC